MLKIDTISFLLQVNAKTPVGLYKKTFIKVYGSDSFNGDSKHFKDLSAILSLNKYKQDLGVGLKDAGFYSTFDYDKIVQGGNEQMTAEIEHYNEEFIESGKLSSLIRLFEDDAETKRGVVNLWENHHLESEKPFPCLTYVWFRKHGNVLHMNCHMRANDAYKILLMDLHIGASLHAYVSQKLGLELGKFNHFVDTLHFYKKDKKEIDSLYSKLKNEK